MSTDTKTLSSNAKAMIVNVEEMDDATLEKELSFAEGFGVGADDENAAVWLAAVRHESRCRGIFVAGDDGYSDLADWMSDSDYTEAAGEWWTEGGAFGPYDPAETYAGAHQAMTWADALDAAGVL